MSDPNTDPQPPGAGPSAVDDDALEFVSGGLKNIASPGGGGGYTVNSTIHY